MEVLVLDGKNYVKASKAAKDLGYATDYVGQLCRSGKVDAHLIGRTWYVDQDMLGTHKVEKKRMSRIKARLHAKKAIEEHRLQINNGSIPTKTHIQYEPDTSELIPETKKLHVESILSLNESSIANTEESDELEIVNKGDKVIMSGDLNVVDVTDGEVADDSIFLTPGRIYKTSTKTDVSKSKKSNKSRINLSITTEDEESHPTLTKSKTFTERLNELSAIAEVTVDDHNLSPVARVPKNDSLFWYIVTLSLLTLIIPATLLTKQTIIYSDSSIPKYIEYISMSTDKNEVLKVMNQFTTILDLIIN